MKNATTAPAKNRHMAAKRMGWDKIQVSKSPHSFQSQAVTTENVANRPLRPVAGVPSSAKAGKAIATDATPVATGTQRYFLIAFLTFNINKHLLII
ncbi:MAG: hypothetical protein SOX46_04635 [Clostridiaceae bacterium]|uniref:hypothetical protein n=1 Tax=Clostridium porci TaxID=2605778 RepID=UPI002A8C7F29|nr:hypothetical protein [Clostridiaceae bacterium]